MYFYIDYKISRNQKNYFDLPMPKLRVRFSKSGLVTFFGSTFLTANGAAATFFPTFFLG